MSAENKIESGLAEKKSTERSIIKKIIENREEIAGWASKLALLIGVVYGSADIAVFLSQLKDFVNKRKGSVIKIGDAAKAFGSSVEIFNGVFEHFKKGKKSLEGKQEIAIENVI